MPLGSRPPAASFGGPAPAAVLLCVACGAVPARGDRVLCGRCRAELAPAPLRRVGGDPGLLVGSFAAHEGAGRRLVHRLKYQGLVAAADVLAAGMVRAVAFPPSVLVPVPRAAVRRLRYGVDPALLLAARLSRRLGVPVVRALSAPLWWRPHAGLDRKTRTAPRYRLVAAVPDRAVLVDDVVTTGSTLLAAAAAVRSQPGRSPGLLAGVTATAAGTMSLYAATARAPSRTFAE